MNDQPSKPSPDAIGFKDMVSVLGGQATNEHEAHLLASTIGLIECMRASMLPLRQRDPGQLDGQLITAAIVYAGMVHGELLALGAAPDITEAAVQKMLLLNWQSGVQIGRKKVERAAAEMGADPITGRKPE